MNTTWHIKFMSSISVFFFLYYLLNWNWASDFYIINVVTTEGLICILYNSSFLSTFFSNGIHMYFINIWFE